MPKWSKFSHSIMMLWKDGQAGSWRNLHVIYTYTRLLLGLRSPIIGGGGVTLEGRYDA